MKIIQWSFVIVMSVIILTLTHWTYPKFEINIWHGFITAAVLDFIVEISMLKHALKNKADTEHKFR